MSGKDVLKLFLLAAIIGGGVSAAAAGAERRRRVWNTLKDFGTRVHEFNARFLVAMRSNWPAWSWAPSEYWALARRDPAAAVQRIVRDVHEAVAWTPDEVTSGESEYWQSPVVTASTGRGDCEDMAMLALDRLQGAGFDQFRVVVGTYKGGGHAWLETEDGSVFADPTAGTVFGGRPSQYEPAIWLGGERPLVRAGLLA